MNQYRNDVQKGCKVRVAVLCDVFLKPTWLGTWKVLSTRLVKFWINVVGSKWKVSGSL